MTVYFYRGAPRGGRPRLIVGRGGGRSVSGRSPDGGEAVGHKNASGAAPDVAITITTITIVSDGAHVSHPVFAAIVIGIDITIPVAIGTAEFLRAFKHGGEGIEGVELSELSLHNGAFLLAHVG